MNKSMQMLLAFTFLALAACANDSQSTSPQNQTLEPAKGPADATTAQCAPDVEKAIVQVAAARKASDKSAAVLDMQSCATLESAIKPESEGPAVCATQFNEKIDLKIEAANCQTVAVQIEEGKAKKVKAEQDEAQKTAEQDEAKKQAELKETEQKQDEQKQIQQAEVQKPAAPAVEVKKEEPGLKLEARSYVPFEKLGMRDWVYVESKNTFGHISSGKMAGSAMIGVKLSHRVDGKTDHISLTDEHITYPVQEGKVELCGQSQELNRDTMISTQDGNIYRVRAMFENGKLLGSLQTAPTGLKSYFPRTHLVDLDPVLLDTKTVTGLQVNCNEGFCEGQQVQNKTTPDDQSEYTIEKIFCDGTMMLSHSGWVSRYEFVDKQADYTSVPQVQTN